MRAPRHRQLPTGTVTFLFTDIEGSTRLLAELGDGYDRLRDAHDAILRAHIAAAGGVEVSTGGDAFFAVFPSALAAVRAAAEAQRSLATHQWPGDRGLSVRMGLHTGEGRLGGDDYAGLDVNRAARIGAVGHGGQVLLSDATRALVTHDLPANTALRDLGEHRLKDLPAPERLWQLDIEGLENAFPALRSLDARPSNLPQSATSLIGREDELLQIEVLLDRRRLVTLTGPGGTGKTRLAIAAAHQLLEKFIDGCFFVALEAARDRPAVASAIAAALNVREKPDRDLEHGVREYVAERELLLVLDNFEQVLEAAPLVAELLAIAPRLRVIVTSRAVLRISGEQEVAVPPLSLPDARLLPSPSALRQYEAVALFIDRATAVRSDFVVTNENAPAVAEICSRLDGLPLAIELAAARIRLLSPQQILERLERGLGLLSGGPRDAAQRQRTLRDTINSSYELVDAPQRRLFARLAVFAGGWTLTAAEEACNPNGELGVDTLDGLASLADYSLVRTADSAEEPRFAMLQVIHDFALEQLEAGGEAEEIRRRHAATMLALVEAAEPELLRADLRRWMNRLRREEENVRAAMRWSLDGGEAEVGLRIAGALWRYWHYWALLREGRAWLEALLALPAAAAPTLGRAKALSALAGLVYWQGEADEAEALYDEALPINEQLGREQAVADGLMDLAWAAAARGDFGAAPTRASKALARYEQLGDRVGVARVKAWLTSGAFLMNLSDSLEEAATAVVEQIDAAERAGLIHEVADGYGSLEMIYQRAGDYGRALDYGRRQLALLHELGNAGRIAPFLKLIAWLELTMGNPGRGVRLAAAAQRLRDQLGGDLPEALTRSGDPIEQARRVLSAEEHAQAVREGQAMSLEEAVAYALDERAAHLVRARS